MGSGKAQPQFVGRITSGISRGELPLKTIAFVREQLPAWRDDTCRPDEEAERPLNLQLSKFLNRLAREKFPMVQFTHEEIQEDGRSVDIGVIESKAYSVYSAFIVFECKRLPVDRPSRKREYVTGEAGKASGGIQRFKLGLHTPELEIVGMIGYIQENSAGHWQEQINEWIAQLTHKGSGDSCVWSNEDKLSDLAGDGSTDTAYCTSTHVRAGKEKTPEIRIHHLWVLMRSRSGN